MTLDSGYSIEKQDKVYCLMQNEECIAEASSLAEVTREYVKIIARKKSKVDECLESIRFPIEVIPDE